jgi:hypothetical protein
VPPKHDPYASRSNRILDLILIIFVIIVVLLTIYTAPKSRSNSQSDAVARGSSLTSK